MAYLLFKYLRRKYKERQATKTVDDSHLVPEPTSGQEHKPERLEGLNVEDTQDTPAPTRTTINEEENARIKEETARRRRYRWKMIIGLILPNFLSAVDVTIVAPAVPEISSHFSTCILIYPHIIR